MAKKPKKKKVSVSTKNKRQFEQYWEALTFYGYEYKQVKRPTKTSITKIKKEWERARKEIKKEEQVELVTVREASKMFKERRTPTPLQSFEGGKQYIEALQQHLQNLYDDCYTRYNAQEKRIEKLTDAYPLLLEAFSMIEAMLDATDYNYDMVADVLKADPNIQKILEVTQFLPSDAKGFYDDVLDYFTACMSELLSSLW